MSADRSENMVMKTRSVSLSSAWVISCSQLGPACAGAAQAANKMRGVNQKTVRLLGNRSCPAVPQLSLSTPSRTNWRLTSLLSLQSCLLTQLQACDEMFQGQWASPLSRSPVIIHSLHVFSGINPTGQIWSHGSWRLLEAFHFHPKGTYFSFPWLEGKHTNPYCTSV